MNEPSSFRDEVTKMEKRFWKQRLFQALCGLSVVFILSFLGLFFVLLLVKGTAALTWQFVTHSDSSIPERAGILGALMGSLLVLGVTSLVGLSLGIMSAIYLKEFAPSNRWTRFLELNINNLASVPPILFGVFGLFVFLSLMHLPRSSILVGGLVLAMVIFPSVVIISSQALASVPPAIRHGALALGASRMQVIFHHVLPMSLPRILTGCLVTLVRSFGETSPLLMVGMVAFIHDVPRGFLDPATTIPIQVYIWSNNPQEVFIHKGAAAVLVLLFFLLALNTLAFWLRGRFEKK